MILSLTRGARRHAGQHTQPWTSRQRFPVYAGSGRPVSEIEIIVTGIDVITRYADQTVSIIPRGRFAYWIRHQVEPLFIQGQHVTWHKHGHDLAVSVNRGASIPLPIKLTADLYTHM